MSGISSRNANIFCVAIVLLLALLVFFQAHYTLSEEAAVFPKLLSFLLSVGALLLLIKTFRHDEHTLYFTNIRYIAILVTLILWCATIYLVTILGFYTASFIFLFLLSTYLTSNKKKAIPINLLYSFSISLILYLIFTVTLQFQLPDGLLL